MPAVTLAIKSIAVIKEEIDINAAVKLQKDQEDKLGKFRLGEISSLAQFSQKNKFCDEVQQKIGAIKLLTLNTVGRVMNKLEQRDPTQMPYIQILNLLIIFMYHSKNPIVIKVVLFLYREMDSMIKDEFDKVYYEEQFKQCNPLFYS